MAPQRQRPFDFIVSDMYSSNYSETCYSPRMFSLSTILFYMLSAYIAFLIGYSPELSLFLVLIVPIGFVLGYLLDRFSSVKKVWSENRIRIIKLAIFQYFVFLLVTGVFASFGLLFAIR